MTTRCSFTRASMRMSMMPRQNLHVLKELHREHVVGTYDAAVVAKNEDGKVKIVDKIEKPTQHGGWAGMAVGAAMGLIFPPSILVGGLLGAGAGALIGHLEGGMSRSDIRGSRGDARGQRGSIDRGWEEGDYRAGGG